MRLAYVVCDRCGELELAYPPIVVFRCTSCGAEAAWEFKREDHAIAYQAQVRERLGAERARS